MEVSVVIPTYNGEKKIGHLLNALLQQSAMDFEVVVVIDGSTDNTEQVLNQYTGRFANFRIIKQQNSGRSIVRNRGAQEAKGDLIIFYDDDICPAVDSISRHMNFHISNPFKTFVAGNLTEESNSQQSDVQNYKAFLSKKWLQPYEKGITKLTIENLFFSAANCSIKRNDFEFLNGFDRRLSDAEDQDLALRALKNGMHIFFDADNRAIHNDIVTATSYLKRLRAYRSAHIKLSQIHHPYLMKNSKSLYKKIIYRLFAFKFWLSLIDSDILKHLLPKIMRFKLYELVFQSLSVENSNVPLH